MKMIFIEGRALFKNQELIGRKTKKNTDLCRFGKQPLL